MEKLNKLYQNDLTLKIVSVVLAIILWYIVITEQNPVISSEVIIPVKLINIDSLTENDMILMDDPQSFSITYRLKGRRDILKNINEKSVKAIADMRGYKSKGDNVVPVEVSGIPQEVDIISKSGDSIRVRLEPIINLQMPVSVNIMGSPKEGFASMTALTNPAEVVIRGAESQVNFVKKVAVDIDVAEAFDLFTKKIPVKVLNSDNKDILNIELTPSVVEVTVPIESTKKVAINPDIQGSPATGNIINGYSISPSDIYIVGNKELLDSVTSISTEKIDISGASDKIQKNIKLKLPQGIEMVNKSENIVIDINIEKIIEKTINIGNIQFRNIAEGLSVKNFEGEIVAVVKGMQSILNEVPSNIVFYIDLKEGKEGINTGNISWEIPNGLEIIDVKPKQFEITLQKQDSEDGNVP